jgi:tripeptidyl-peptidase I
MTADEVVDFFAPHQSTVDAVTEWLVESGISADRFAISANKQVGALSHSSMKPFGSSAS